MVPFEDGKRYSCSGTS